MLKILFIFLVALSSFPLHVDAFQWNGSFLLSVRQRYFEDSKFGKQNRIEELGTLDIGISGGLFEILPGLEPIFGVSYLWRNGKSLPAVTDVNGALSQDKFYFQFVTSSLGLRYKFWSPNLFFIIPFAEAEATYRFGRFKKRTAAVGQKRSVTGGDFGGSLGGGLIFSFMVDAETRVNMHEQWDLKDFGILVGIRYLPAGIVKHGLAGIKTTGGWDFGGGLYTDW